MAPDRSLYSRRTVLVGSGSASWKEWLREYRADRDLLCLDPTSTAFGPPASFSLWRDDRPVWTHFYGSLDPQRAPQVTLAALAQALRQANHGLVVCTYPYRTTPVVRNLTGLVLSMIDADEVLIPDGLDLEERHVGCRLTSVATTAAFVPDVQAAQRKAHWIKLLESCSNHELSLRDVMVEGARLGTGTPLTEPERVRCGLADCDYAEKAGRTLYVVATDDPADSAVSRALDVTGSSRAHIASPAAFEGLACAFVRADGEEIGMGMIESIDWPNGTVHALNTAIPPAPVSILRLGALRIDINGRELGELPPWRV